jgi:hypothetical protein
MSDPLQEAIEATGSGKTPSYDLRPFDPSLPSIRELFKAGEAIQWGAAAGKFAVRVRLSRDNRRLVLEVPTQRQAKALGQGFVKRLRDYLDAEECDKLWNLFVLQVDRQVSVRLRQVAGIDPPEDVVMGPAGADGHEHEWRWTGTYTPARPYPVWHMRCAVCFGWALLANKVETATGMWVGYDDAVHDIRTSDGTPVEATVPQ